MLAFSGVERVERVHSLSPRVRPDNPARLRLPHVKPLRGCNFWFRALRRGNSYASPPWAAVLLVLVRVLVQVLACTFGPSIPAGLREFLALPSLCFWCSASYSCFPCTFAVAWLRSTSSPGIPSPYSALNQPLYRDLVGDNEKPYPGVDVRLPGALRRSRSSRAGLLPCVLLLLFFLPFFSSLFFLPGVLLQPPWTQNFQTWHLTSTSSWSRSLPGS